MKILFLDIIGVLCSARSCAAYGGYPAPEAPETWDRFDETAIQLLKCLIYKTGCEVVLASTWRTKANLDALQYRLGIRFRSVTRPHTKDDSRGQRVKDWLAQNPTEIYAILDDDDDFYQSQMEYLALTSKRNGFLLGHYDELLAVLRPSEMIEE